MPWKQLLPGFTAAGDSDSDASSEPKTDEDAAAAAGGSGKAAGSGEGGAPKKGQRGRKRRTEPIEIEKEDGTKEVVSPAVREMSPVGSHADGASVQLYHCR